MGQVTSHVTFSHQREELDEKDFHLKLLSADVQLATREINNVNEWRKETDGLKQ